MVSYHRKYCCRQDLPMDIKVGGQKLEGKQDICIASKYNSLQKCINYKGKDSNFAVEEVISHHLN